MKRLSLLAALAVASPLHAQMAAPSAPAVDLAAATITAPAIAKKVGIIAHDSMEGRDTPSRGLELTAQWVADEFKRAGLKPAGENGTWFQRYPLRRSGLDAGQSSLTLRGPGGAWTGSFSRDVVSVRPVNAAASVRGEVVVASASATAEQVTATGIRGKVLLVVTGGAGGRARIPAGVQAALREGVAAVVLLGGRTGEAFDAQLTRQTRSSITRVSAEEEAPAPVIEVRGDAADAFLEAAGVDAAAVREDKAGVARAVPGVTAELKIATSAGGELLSAPNTIGMIEGTDPKLKAEYVMFTAHMDHVGTTAGGRCRAQGADSTCNGADDDASGTVTVVELARAFAAKGARPKRTMVFMTVSGEERGLWGSAYWADHPTLPLANVVANVNIDMVGRNWPDTIVAIGKEHSDLGATLNRVNAQHPELGMTAIDDIWPDENFYRRSDHYNFARKGVPVLFFFNGVHDDYHQASDSPDKINAEKMARLARLIFYLGQDIGNAATRPQWNPESYKAVVEPSGTT
jgi:hypothetical protein